MYWFRFFSTIHKKLYLSFIYWYDVVTYILRQMKTCRLFNISGTWYNEYCTVHYSVRPTTHFACSYYLIQYIVIFPFLSSIHQPWRLDCEEKVRNRTKANAPAAGWKCSLRDHCPPRTSRKTRVENIILPVTMRILPSLRFHPELKSRGTFSPEIEGHPSRVINTADLHPDWKINLINMGFMNKFTRNFKSPLRCPTQKWRLFQKKYTTQTSFFWRIPHQRCVAVLKVAPVMYLRVLV